MPSIRARALFIATWPLPGTLTARSRALISISVRRVVIVIAAGQSEREDTVTAVSKFERFVGEQRSRFRAYPPIDPSSSDGRPAFDTAGGCLGAVSKFDLLVEFEKLLAIVGIQSHHGSPLIGIANKDHAITNRQCAKG